VPSQGWDGFVCVFYTTLQIIIEQLFFLKKIFSTELVLMHRFNQNPPLGANYRLSENGGGKPSSRVSINEDGVLRCVCSDGASISIRIADLLNRESIGNQREVEIPASHVSCILSNGTAIECEGHMRPRDGFIRLDASDQEDYYWFWFEVNPGCVRTSRP
jgi:hypothetical protein